MILRNKKTGELGYFCFADWDSPTIIIVDNNGIQLAKYNSLAELNTEWEDYEEPKKFWYITAWGDVHEYSQSQFAIKQKQAIGNYFETKEEAELAVRKLKAWKRLKDKGFCFCGTDCVNKNNVIYFEFGERPLTQSEVDEVERDLDTCFGGEE